MKLDIGRALDCQRPAFCIAKQFGQSKTMTTEQWHWDKFHFDDQRRNLDFVSEKNVSSTKAEKRRKPHKWKSLRQSPNIQATGTRGQGRRKHWTRMHVRFFSIYLPFLHETTEVGVDCVHPIRGDTIHEESQFTIPLFGESCH